jgi:hypothetical protein
MSAHQPPSRRWVAGGCHCGAVRFEAEIEQPALAQACNCSMCEKLGFIHLIVPESRFRLTEGAERLTAYSFNTGVAQHLFCSTCGIKSFYRPRSNPDGWSVNARCLDDPGALDIRIEAFDGRHWEANAASLAHLSREAS